MADIEKVIKGLECHAEVNCVECPYRDGWRTCSFGETLLADALAMLKEQENEYENGFNDAMLGKQELMYEGMDGKWHKKDW